jgi:hypothetical protein
VAWCKRRWKCASLFAFYDWCAQNDDIPGLVTLARVSYFAWERSLDC